MAGALDVLTRGRDSSGRLVRATRQAFQHFDRVNATVGGKLVIVQGAFVSGTAASAGTHDRAGCLDIRTWNLTDAERFTAIKEARRLGAAAWYRHRGQGFDPHMHWVLIGDAPMAPLATAQIDMYRKGFNGLGWYAYPDDFPWRPKRIRAYKYLEDDMFDAKAEKTINDKLDRLLAMGDAEVDRDANARHRAGRHHQRMVKEFGEIVDELGLLHNQTADDATKTQVRRLQRRMLDALAADTETPDEDTPSSEALAEASDQS